MRFFPTILDRYIFRELALSFVAVMSFCALLLLVANIFERFSEVMEHDAPIRVAALYFLTNLPSRLIEVVPIASMLAVLFSVGGLARTNEVLAMLTNGVHGLRISVPVLFAGVLIVTGTFLMNEYVVPPLERASERFALQMEGKSTGRIHAKKNVFAQGRDNWLYMARVFDSKTKRMGRPTIVQLTEDRTNLRKRIEAASAVCIQNLPDEKRSVWILEAPRIWSFDQQKGTITSYQSSETSVSIDLEENLPTLLGQTARAEEMNFHQLRQRVEILQARNQPVNDLQTDLYSKVTFPLGTLVIMMIGFAYAVRARPGTVMSIFGYGVGWAVVYYVTNAFMQALGHNGAISPGMATIFPTAVFLLVASVYVRLSYRWHA